jgi:hypothetical protein
MVPIPSPIRRSPGAKAQTLGEPLTRVSRTPMPAIVTTKHVHVRAGEAADEPGEGTSTLRNAALGFTGETRRSCGTTDITPFG